MVTTVCANAPGAISNAALRIEPERSGEMRRDLAGIAAADQRACHQALEVVRFGQCLAERREAGADLIELAAVAGELEQSGRVAAAKTCLYAAGMLHAPSFP